MNNRDNTKNTSRRHHCRREVTIVSMMKRLSYKYFGRPSADGADIYSSGSGTGYARTLQVIVFGHIAVAADLDDAVIGYMVIDAYHH